MEVEEVGLEENLKHVCILAERATAAFPEHIGAQGPFPQAHSLKSLWEVFCCLFC